METEIRDLRAKIQAAQDMKFWLRSRPGEPINRVVLKILEAMEGKTSARVRLDLLGLYPEKFDKTAVIESLRILGFDAQPNPVYGHHYKWDIRPQPWVEQMAIRLVMSEAGIEIQD